MTGVNNLIVDIANFAGDYKKKKLKKEKGKKYLRVECWVFCCDACLVILGWLASVSIESSTFVKGVSIRVATRGGDQIFLKLCSTKDRNRECSIQIVREQLEHFHLSDYFTQWLQIYNRNKYPQNALICL